MLNQQNGTLSALPYLAMWLFSIAFSVSADAIRKNKILNTTQTRKVFTTIGKFIQLTDIYFRMIDLKFLDYSVFSVYYRTFITSFRTYWSELYRMWQSRHYHFGKYNKEDKL
jgi:hypothetical protein